ncbi:CDP-diacylglycerol--serine O-phosphatidyltransferase [Marinomonas sp. IMCC 4694]|uniref:CDP-diacylglycerol--serine O-phosphatidyltransferase n=1 Tax=Marinomonas sp. IMCC 4694 TaxID=2605432 RepID=UPI0011E7E7CB|nr:CDP-diacylglycerol--serine O-phosphatidyltransferase [Marinomonas sp. IMCC 4694]TYL47617.1 CDP-diacylglycerol--serine O-phosphatidyltransferase [Marinomonas sp. IMCC 4694]
MPIRRLFGSLPAFAVDPNQFHVLPSALGFREYVLNAIRNATSRIYLVALYLEDDEAGREILTAAYEAKQRNPRLDVAICVDWHRAQRGLIGAKNGTGNAAMYQAFADKFPHPIPVYGVPVRNREVFGVLHLKGCVIDDSVIYSGASFNNVYLHFHDRYRFDRYHVIQHTALANSIAEFIQYDLIDHPAVQDLSHRLLPTTKALKPAIRQFRLALGKATYRVDNQPVSEGQVAVTPLVGVGRRGNDLNQTIITMLVQAVDELVLCTPYFNLPKVVLREIKRAIKRGVKVSIVVGDKKANDFYIAPDQPFKAISGLPYLYEMNLRKFAAVNERHIASGQLSIHLWKHGGNSFHLKGLWVDRRIMLLTGNNVNPRAWALDLENGLLINDPKQHLLAKFSEEFDTIYQHTQRIDSLSQFEVMDDYPAKVQRLLKKVIRTRADRLLKRIL